MKPSSSHKDIVEKHKTFIAKKPLIVSGIILLILISAFPSLYFYYKYHQVQQLLQNAPSGSREEIKALVEKVGKLIELPTDEEPTVATVTDLEKLKDQPFFARAKIGDKVLIYNNAKKAILYDPIADRVIEIGPLVIPSPTSTVSTSSSLSPTLSSAPTSSLSADLSPPATKPSSLNIVLYNGTDISGLTNTVEKQLRKFSAYQVINKDYATRTDYPKTLVIDLASSKEDEARKLAEIVEGQVSSLPEGEAKPQADFLIIVGEDKK